MRKHKRLLKFLEVVINLNKIFKISTDKDRTYRLHVLYTAADHGKGTMTLTELAGKSPKSPVLVFSPLYQSPSIFSRRFKMSPA